MLDFSNVVDLSLIWGGLILVAIFLYVFLDGFDLGVGILFPFAPEHKCRDRMMNSIAPFWDGNETWLILGGGGLFAAFPLAYSIIMSALYLPIILMLIALVFRGVAFEFRYKADQNHRFIWDYVFHFGSLFAAFAQGLILGGIVQGLEVKNRSYVGPLMGHITPFSIMTGFAVVAGYALLGSTWLIMKTEDLTQKWARKSAGYIFIYFIFFLGIVSLWVPLMDEKIFARWYSTPNIFYLAPIPILVLVSIYGFIKTLKNKSEHWPFLITLFMFLLCYIGLIVGLWPNIVPHQISFKDAAAAPTSQSLLLVGAAITLPIILAYTGYCYYVFRGKSSHEGHY